MLFTDAAIALLARRGAIASPPVFLADVALLKQPTRLRAGVLRPLGDAVARYEKERRGDSPEHDALVDKLATLIENEEIRASQHPVLADLRKYVGEQRARRRLAVNETSPKIRWA